ncbi:hypothetical protein [uncultured Sphingomonas sp.]|uniref:hypothetical protein n=1 Tax=uncultured Sphingomonas sp. TaxID=158754 RepID=UPI0025F7776D|nr:hypothetical protein [uncultured Sphingomonas sp.]
MTLTPEQIVEVTRARKPGPYLQCLGCGKDVTNLVCECSLREYREREAAKAARPTAVFDLQHCREGAADHHGKFGWSHYSVYDMDGLYRGEIALTPDELHRIGGAIIEAHGADAAPARPTPFPASMDDLVYDADGMSQPFLTGGEWPLWLPMEAAWTPLAHGDAKYVGPLDYGGELAIRVRRREPKRETVKASVELMIRRRGERGCPRNIGLGPIDGTIDLIDGKPDLSTLKIEEGAL